MGSCLIEKATVMPTCLPAAWLDCLPGTWLSWRTFILLPSQKPHFGWPLSASKLVQVHQDFGFSSLNSSVLLFHFWSKERDRRVHKACTVFKRMIKWNFIVTTTDYVFYILLFIVFSPLSCAWSSESPYDRNLQYHLDIVHLSTLLPNPLGPRIPWPLGGCRLCEQPSTL